MATCDQCGHYAYYRVDGSKRCISCNYDDQIPINQSTFQPINSDHQRHDAGLTPEEYQRLIKGI